MVGGEVSMLHVNLKKCHISVTYISPCHMFLFVFCFLNLISTKIKRS